MALETLKGVDKIADYNVVVMDDIREKRPDMFREDGSMIYFEKEIRPNNFIYIRHDVNSISFTLQNGPIKENGVNGCQVDTIIEAAKIILEGLNNKFPCEENYLAISGLRIALTSLNLRKRDREARGVEGYYEIG